MVNKQAYESIFGNQPIKNALIGFCEKSTFPHAVIISGPKGSGKATFARLFAMSLSCKGEKKPCMSCPSCKKISEEISPDVILTGNSKDRKTIGIEAVREIKESAYIRPNDLDVKVYIINNAETMTNQAQNALLKLFEEPPVGVYFVLLCSSSSGLLPTVRSRAPELRCELFNNKTMTELLISKSRKAKTLYDTYRDEFERILHISAGSYGEALRLIEESDKKTFSGFDAAEKTILSLSGSNKADFLLSLLSSSSSRENLSELYRLMILAARDMVAVRKRKSKSECELLFFVGQDDARSFSSNFTLKSLLDICDALLSAEAQLNDTNINLQVAVTVTAERLWSLK